MINKINCINYSFLLKYITFKFQQYNNQVANGTITILFLTQLFNKQTVREKEN